MTYTGWKIDDVLDITLPQANMLFREMGDMPAPAVVIGALMKSFQEKKEIAKEVPDSAAEKAPTGSGSFLAKLGIKAEG